MKTLRFRRSALFAALAPMLSACIVQVPAPDTTREAAAAQRAVASLPPECSLGTSGPGISAPGTRSTWMTTTKTVPVSGHAITYVYSFDKAVPARGLRVALNRQALRDLDKVETRDAAGEWHDAGAVARREAPAACAFVWLEHALPDTRQVNGLRFSFRRQSGTLMALNPAVLQAGGS